MEWWLTFALIVVVLLLLLIYWYGSIPKNLPPGPMGLPLLGYMPFVTRDIYKTMNYLGKAYGSIFHFYIGSQLIIVLNDFKVIKEGLINKGHNFAGRPNFVPNLDFYDEWTGGIIFTSGEFWNQHRRFLIQSFKINGMGTSALEPLIIDEIHHFINEIGLHQGTAFHLLELSSMSMSNSIQILATGKRLEYDDSILRNLVKSFKHAEKLSHVLKYFMAFPWAKNTFKLIFYNQFKKGRKINRQFKKLYQKILNGSKERFVKGESDSYMQSYLIERENRLAANENENIFTEQGLLNNVRDLLVGGTDTSATTFTWGAIYMILYPDVQKKVQQEIDQVIGRNREPTYNDRLNTPYTEATILEIHRFATIITTPVPRRVVKSTTLRGYNIPENAVVYSNVWAVHNDPKLWGDPENFRPERFLSSDGKCLKPEYLIPFSIGKRACPGELLARMELYLYIVCLLQRFDFVEPIGEKLTLELKSAMVMAPKSDLVCVVPRKD